MTFLNDFSYIARTLVGSQLNLMAKISTLESHFFTFSTFFVRVLVHNANVVGFNVHRTQFFIYILVKIS